MALVNMDYFSALYLGDKVVSFVITLTYFLYFTTAIILPDLIQKNPLSQESRGLNFFAKKTQKIFLNISPLGFFQAAFNNDNKSYDL